MKIVEKRGLTTLPTALNRTLVPYDSMVGNSRQISKGDLVLIRDSTRLTGVARIEYIDCKPGEKQISRCPVCNTSGPKRRKTRIPPWRCGKKHQFESPLISSVPVTYYSAYFKNTWLEPKFDLDAVALKSLALKPSDQASIEELDFSKVIELLWKSDASLQKLLALAIECSSDLPPAISEEKHDPGAEFLPSLVDRRQKVLRSIRERLGQAKFRNRLIKRYGERCMLSGCGLLSIVEAAHIYAYLGKEDNHSDNGLLLRADLHTLFDLHLLGFEPETLLARFNPRALANGYGEYEGRKLGLDSAGVQGPSKVALRERWSAFLHELGSY